MLVLDELAGARLLESDQILDEQRSALRQLLRLLSTQGFCKTIKTSWQAKLFPY